MAKDKYLNGEGLEKLNTELNKKFTNLEKSDIASFNTSKPDGNGVININAVTKNNQNIPVLPIYNGLDAQYPYAAAGTQAIKNINDRLELVEQNESDNTPVYILQVYGIVFNSDHTLRITLHDRMTYPFLDWLINNNIEYAMVIFEGSGFFIRGYVEVDFISEEIILQLNDIQISSHSSSITPFKYEPNKQNPQILFASPTKMVMSFDDIWDMETRVHLEFDMIKLLTDEDTSIEQTKTVVINCEVMYYSDSGYDINMGISVKDLKKIYNTLIDAQTNIQVIFLSPLANLSTTETDTIIITTAKLTDNGFAIYCNQTIPNKYDTTNSILSVFGATSIQTNDFLDKDDNNPYLIWFSKWKLNTAKVTIKRWDGA